MHADQQITPKPKLRWYQPSPGRLLVFLLTVEGILLLSERFQWFAFNEKQGWSVLIAIASVGVVMIFMLLWLVLAIFFRWGFQFSIRSLFILTIAVAIPSSWLAVKMKRADRQREAVEALSALGGQIEYDYDRYSNGYMVSGGQFPQDHAWLRKLLGDDFFRKATYVFLYKMKVTDANLEPLTKLVELQSLELSFTSITDTGLESLEGLKQLQYLRLGSTQITDAGLKHLKGLNQLRILSLWQTQITDAGLEHIEEMKQLQEIELQGTKITDGGLEHLKGLQQLQKLYLSRTKITDVGIEHLKGLNQLHEIHLGGTQITDAGLENLKGMKRLLTLELSKTNVTDVGLTNLKGLNQLQSLILDGTKITDAGLEHLEGLNLLQFLNLHQTLVTDTEVEKLKKALPNLQIRR